MWSSKELQLMMKELSFLYNCLFCVSQLNLNEFQMTSLKGLVLPYMTWRVCHRKRYLKIKLASPASIHYFGISTVLRVYLCHVILVSLLKLLSLWHNEIRKWGVWVPKAFVIVDIDIWYYQINNTYVICFILYLVLTKSFWPILIINL